MPQTTNQKQYIQKYVKTWENEIEFKGWLKPCIGDNTKARCAFCNIDILAHRKSLKTHSCTKKHIQNAKNDKECLQLHKIENFTTPHINDRRKIAELKIAAFIAEHCSINAIDDLGKIIKDLDATSHVLTNIKIHRVDGTNSMVGKNDSVASRLKRIIPHLVVIKCVCHSLHLTAEKSCDVLPRNLDYLVKKSHTWFSHSTKRIIEYRKIYETINQNMPKKIAKLSGTRWLARIEAIKTIIDQWDELKLHFEMAKNSNRCSEGYVAEELYNMYKNDENKIYLIFLRDALKDITNINKLFQSNEIEPLKLFKDLNHLLYLILQKIVVPSQLEKVKHQDLTNYNFQDYLMFVDCVDYGYYFNEFSSKINPQNLKDIKERCKAFYIELVKQLQKRIPENLQILEKLSYFTSENAMNKSRNDIIDIVVSFKEICLDIESTVKEWNSLHRFEVNTNNSEDYWAKVNNETDAAGEKRFGHVSKLVLALLCLPFSNAEVERAFSIMNIIKDKLRNRLIIRTLDAILRVRFLLPNTCRDFQPSRQMLQKFVSETVYGGQIDNEALDALDYFDMIEKFTA
ncbi:PREDICTED: uncharacterized protein LOC108763808 [Trachymyrmex cornetzi]|uniref:uncharacterized protein LOC108762966 n=1 Tax=Trachymyrmex cornetzi TaxID=471704 RepID=UPI00084EE5FE|nr:PREDICTED: uncharacterized protein LOC108762966 [Trachymyrmex cornetzi]XP_018367124.1 PREDICTED: uncharacterized protein LOC108763761 [Trachymyrmex cornetzi]XP_018367194.1 PREDICTED: uncharacterized protein LOC108763808 [Trachymyrmex cornetzi]